MEMKIEAEIFEFKEHCSQTMSFIKLNAYTVHPLFRVMFVAKSFDIDRSSIVLGDLLGVGQFGDVFKGSYSEGVSYPR